MTTITITDLGRGSTHITADPLPTSSARARDMLMEALVAVAAAGGVPREDPADFLRQRADEIETLMTDEEYTQRNGLQ